MGSISPVLEAFLKGQQQQSNIIQQARAIQNAQEERQQRQQQIDEIVRQHGVENKQSQQRLDLEQQLHKLNYVKAQDEVTQKFRRDLQDESVSIHMARPGLEAPAVPASQLQQPGGATQFAIPGVSVPPTPDTTQTMDHPLFGKITIPTPQTDTQVATNKQAALLPGQVEAERQKSNIDADAYVKKMMPELNRKLEVQQAISDAKLEQSKNNTDIKVQLAEIAANGKLDRFFREHGIDPDPQVFRQKTGLLASQLATGVMDSGELSHFDPMQAHAATAALSSAGFAIPKKGTRDAITGLFNDATQFLNGIDTYKQTLGAPQTLTGKASNILSDKLGIAGLSSYKSIYDMLSLDQLPRLEKTLGMTAGALSRSPKLLDKIKGIIPMPGDKAGIVDEKEANGADLFLSAAARQMSGLPPAQRALIYQDIVNQHPELVNRSKLLQKKLIDAGNTGNYEAGSFFKDFTKVQ